VQTNDGFIINSADEHVEFGTGLAYKDKTLYIDKGVIIGSMPSSGAPSSNETIGDLIIDVKIYYLASQLNGTTGEEPSPDDEKWQETMPVPKENEYIWQKSIITKVGSSTPTISIVCISGAAGKEGKGIKKINTTVRSFPYYAEDKYSWTGIYPKNKTTTSFVTPGHIETWTANLSDNLHINIGDTAYLVGEVSDQFAANGLRQSITLYGEVTKVAQNGVTMTTTTAIWGGV
jgi:hypothetical protein